MSEHSQTSDTPRTELSPAERWSLTLAALDHLDQGHTVFDRHLRLVTWNRRFLELLDFPPELAQVGTHFSEFIRYNANRGEYGPGDTEAQVEERLRQAGSFTPHRFERVRPDGTILEIKGYPIRGGEGFVAVYTDVTDQRRAEAALRESQAHLEARVRERTRELTELNRQLELEIASHEKTAMALRERERWIRLITDAMPALIAYIDTDRCYRFANRKHCEVFGVSPSVLIGRPLEALFDPEVYQRLRPHVEAALRGQEAAVEYEMRDAQGRRLYLRSSFIPHVDDRGWVLGFFNLGQDLTAHRQAQEALNQAQKMEAVGQLTGGIAHDFNNILTIIMGNLAFLEEYLADKPMPLESVQTALKATQRGADLTGRLLAFSRRQRLRPEPVSPLQQASEMGALLRQTLGAIITVETLVDEGSWEAMVDPGQLANALLNLGINARDAMPDGGKLTIEVSNVVVGETRRDLELGPGDYVLLRVTDTGTGMSPEVVERAFEPFFTTKGVGAGSGLGLSMVYGFAKQSGGDVRIRSQLGRGTTVELYLPRAPGQRQAVGGKSSPEQGELGGEETVLVVEDDRDVRHFVWRVLTGLGYRVLEAEDGRAALAVLEEREPAIDLLVTDLVMPGGISGRELVDQARTRQPGIRVLCMSGYPDKIAMERASLGKDCMLINKPFQKAELARAVRTALDRH